MSQFVEVALISVTIATIAALVTPEVGKWLAVSMLSSAWLHLMACNLGLFGTWLADPRVIAAHRTTAWLYTTLSRFSIFGSFASLSKRLKLKLCDNNNSNNNNNDEAASRSANSLANSDTSSVASLMNESLLYEQSLAAFLDSKRLVANSLTTIRDCVAY